MRVCVCMSLGLCVCVCVCIELYYFERIVQAWVGESPSCSGLCTGL